MLPRTHPSRGHHVAFSLILPYYRNPLMLGEQLAIANLYPREIDLIVVDDGSPEPALPIITALATRPVSLYRIEKDIPWNRGGAQLCCRQRCMR